MLAKITSARPVQTLPPATFEKKAAPKLAFGMAPTGSTAGLQSRVSSPGSVIALRAGKLTPEKTSFHPASFDAPGEAKKALGRPLTKAESKAVLKAHWVGVGEVGKNGVDLASVGNFTKGHLTQKYRILQDAGLDAREIRTLMRAGIVGATHGDAAHFAICTDLFNGNIIESAPFNANANQTKLFKVKVYNPATGGTREALFKPRFPGDNDGWGRSPIEYVAYALNRMLGMDHVPPVAYRHNVTVAGQHFSEGALLYMVPDAHLLKKVGDKDWGVGKDSLLSDTRVLDVLIQNSDRHGGNFIRGKHWVDGSYKPALIDHAAGFRHGASVTMEHDNAFLTGKVRTVKKSTLESLKKLDYDWLKHEVGEFLSHHEIKDVLARRDGVVAYFENRIKEHGAAKVVVE